MTEQLQIAIVDDHPLFREGVAHSLGKHPDIHVVAQGASADEAIAIAGQQLPDVLLLDVSLPGGGVTALRQIAASYPVVKVIMLTVSQDEDDVTSALRGGARAYVLKGVAARELAEIVRSVAAGDVYVTPSLAATLLFDLSSPAPSSNKTPRLLDELTERERQILEGVAEGDSNKEIAVHLQLSEKTVKHHMTNILQKLQVRNRVEAALLARKE
jgi:two-component system, NarL family, nitrate/nitrite response regulator NarL